MCEIAQKGLSLNVRCGIIFPCMYARRGRKMLGYISIRGAKVNNLKNIDVKIPRDKLTVVTGLSGSR